MGKGFLQYSRPVIIMVAGFFVMYECPRLSCKTDLEAACRRLFDTGGTLASGFAGMCGNYSIMVTEARRITLQDAFMLQLNIN